MKKLIYASFFIAMAAVTGCTGTAATSGENNAFILNGNATGLDGEYLYLAYESNNGITKDSALVTNGQFKFTGNLAYFMTDATLFTKEGERPASSTKVPRTNLHLEATEMSIELNGNDFSNARLKGSLTQEQVDSVYTLLKPLLEEANDLHYNKLRTEKDPEKLAAYKKRVQEITQQYTTAIENFIKTHPDSYYTVEQLSMRTGRMSLEEMEEAYNKLSPKLKASRAGNAIKKELDVLKSVAPGQPAPDFTTTDIKGEKLSLSDLRGKVVLLDFWASWCVPCRKSNPHLLELYKKYHDKGFEILCVGDNDSSEAAWKKAIEDDGTQAFRHVLRGLKRTPEGGFDKSSDISEKYAIHFLPTKFLIDREGKIIGKMNDEEIDTKLKEIFGE